MAEISPSSQEAAHRQGTNLLIESHDLFQAGRYEAAARVLPKAIDAFRYAQDEEGELSGLWLLSTAFAVQGQTRNAESCLRAALVLARRLRDPEPEQMLLVQLGKVLTWLGSIDEALLLLSESLDLARRLRDPSAELTVRSQLGFCLMRQGKYQLAMQELEQAAHIARKIGDASGEAEALSNQGSLFHYMGDFQRSIEKHQAALEIHRSSGNPRGQAAVLSEMGRPYLAAGEPEIAEECNQEALEISRQTGDLVVQGSALAHLAHLALLRLDYPSSRSYLTESLDLKKITGDIAGTAASMASLSMVHLAMGSQREALDLAERSLDLIRQVGAPEDVGMSWMNLGFVRFRCWDLPGAEKALRESLGFLESLTTSLRDEDRWQISLSDRHFSVYRYLQQVLVASGQAEPALEIAERGRARAMARLMERHRSSETVTDSPPAGLIRISDIQKIAREQQATLVEYSLLPDPIGNAVDSLLIWVVQPHGEVTVRLRTLGASSAPSAGREVPPGQRSDRKNRLRALILEEEAGQGMMTSWRSLYQELIEPIESLLPQEREARVVLIPQDDLFLVPWAGLEDQTGSPLIDRYAISLAPSIHTLGLAIRRSKALDGSRDEALVVGEPVLSLNLPPLPAAAQEARMVASLLNTVPLLGQEATKDAVLRRITNKRILHLATHGLLEDFDGLDVPGAIALASSGPGDDGLLKSVEIMNLQLDAELVVLSACHTGQGRASSDSIIGLARAFLAAGAPSLVVSLDVVPDNPTACLMIAFHEALARGLGKAHSLREAMLATRRRYPDPRDWAGFILLGDGA